MPLKHHQTRLIQRNDTFSEPSFLPNDVGFKLAVVVGVPFTLLGSLTSHPPNYSKGSSEMSLERLRLRIAPSDTWHHSHRLWWSAVAENMTCLSAQCLTLNTFLKECTQLFVLSETSKRGGISWPVDLATTCFHFNFKTVRDGVRNTLVIQDKIREQIPLKHGLKMMALPLPSSLNSKSCTDLSNWMTLRSLVHSPNLWPSP